VGAEGGRGGFGDRLVELELSLVCWKTMLRATMCCMAMLWYLILTVWTFGDVKRKIGVKSFL
jgi:hypothetical protein